MKKGMVILLSFIYTLFIIVGTSFILTNSFSMLVKHPFISIISSILLIVLFYIIISYLYELLDKYKSKRMKIKNRYLLIFDKHPIVVSMIIMIILWLPYIIAYYPAILNPDSVFQIRQYLGIHNKYSTYVNLIDPKQIITNHHPVIHTLLLGSCVKFGLSIGNANIGFFIYSIIQILFLSFVLSYTIKYLKDLKINIYYRLGILAIYSLVPVFPYYAMTAVKDVLYTCVVILYIVFLHKIIKNRISIKNSISLIIVSILLFLLRNNGIYIVYLSLPFLLIKNKDWKKVLLLIVIIISLNITYNNKILPYFKVTPTSIRETLSIPFQQTARYINYHEKDLSIEDKKNIEAILDYNSIKKNYNPELSDPVKNTFNKDYSEEELKKYMKTWMKGLKKHPITYIEATINNTYGYFYPVKTNWYLYRKYEKKLLEDNIDYHYNNMIILRTQLSAIGLVFPYIPLIGLLVNIGFNTWVILFLFNYLLYKKKYRDIIWLMPSITTILVCFASPANTYFRYALPYIFSMPLIIGLLFHSIKRNTK